MADAPDTSPKAPNQARARTLFFAALGLFLLWVAALVGLAVVSGYRPMDRAGALPSALAPEVENAD